MCKCAYIDAYTGASPYVRLTKVNSTAHTWHNFQERRETKIEIEVVIYPRAAQSQRPTVSLCWETVTCRAGFQCFPLSPCFPALLVGICLCDFSLWTLTLQAQTIAWDTFSNESLILWTLAVCSLEPSSQTDLGILASSISRLIIWILPIQHRKQGGWNGQEQTVL